MQTIKKYLLAFAFILPAVQGYNQNAGRTFIRNYPPLEYRASQQNWSVVQDSRGIMYFGNNDGLLEFDGINWKLIKLPIVRTIAIDKSGRIYVGLENDMGYLEVDSIGNYCYKSLKPKIPEIHRDLTTVLYAYFIGDEVVFLADDKIFIYKNDQIKVVTSEKGFHHIFLVRNRIYVREREKGLMYLENDSLKFISGSEQFANERIYSMLPVGKNEILIFTRTQGVITYSPGSPGKFYKPDGFNEVDDFLLNNPVYCGTNLTGESFAVGALTGGIIVFDNKGKITNKYNKSTGLLDNTIYWLYSDQNQQLWASLDNGISMIPVNLPFRNYSEYNNLNGSPMCIQFFNNRLYAGTSQYLHIQNKQGNFELIEGTDGQNFRLFEASGSLLLAGYQGIFEIKDKKAISLSAGLNIIGLTFCTLKNHPGFLLAGASDEGLYVMENKNSSWKLKCPVKNFSKSVYVAIEDEFENIWISTTVDLYKLKINSVLDSVISCQQYTSNQGLPSNNAIPYQLNSGEIVFGTEKGIYRYNRVADRFELHPDFEMLTGKVLPFVQIENGDIWFEELLENGNFEKGVLKFKNGKYIPYKTPFYKFTDIRCYESPFTICSAPDSSIFIGTSSGLLQYNPAVKLKNDQSFNTLIRMVFSKDKLLFGGTVSDLTKFEITEGKNLDYRDNDIIFHFAATYYEDPEKNLYSYRLLGSDTAWSVWVKDHKKEYTNLREGEYTFEVRSKNQYHQIGCTGSYTFLILPPWYRNWFAYGIYVVITTVFIWLIVKLNIHRLVKQKEHLENIVALRTSEVLIQKKEIQEKNEELNQTNDKLNEANEELRATIEIVKEQKSQIEIAHENMTDSINYAQKIQQAVLPGSEMMKQLLPQHFVLYKPRDVVSGDFYWVKKINRFIVLATADCTGHGVPGALMSMLCIGLLNEIISDEDVNTTGEVLNRLRAEVKKSLKQEGKSTEQKEGMDIALVVIDTENHELQFSGANNPLYLIRSTENLDDFNNLQSFITNEHEKFTLIEIKADKQPIGIHDIEKPFITHFIKVKENDMIYTFSDGFMDQTGGGKNRKFQSQNFKALLLDVHHEDLPEQCRILDKTIEDWKNNQKQVDDILVIGVRI